MIFIRMVHVPDDNAACEALIHILVTPVDTIIQSENGIETFNSLFKSNKLNVKLVLFVVSLITSGSIIAKETVIYR